MEGVPSRLTPVAWTACAYLTGRPPTHEKGGTMTDFAINSAGPRTFFLSGDLDMSTAPLMETAIAPALAMGGPVTLDLSDLAFIDSSGVGSIVRSLRALPSGCIVLHGVRSAAQRVIQIMGVDQASANLHVIPCAVPV